MCGVKLPLHSSQRHSFCFSRGIQSIKYYKKRTLANHRELSCISYLNKILGVQVGSHEDNAVHGTGNVHIQCTIK